MTLWEAGKALVGVLGLVAVAAIQGVLVLAGRMRWRRP